MDSAKPIFGYKMHSKREIASLTKLVTLFVSLEIASQEGIDCETHQCRVSKNSATRNGTTACLKSGDILKLKDLYFGMSSSSRHDAAQRERCCAESL